MFLTADDGAVLSAENERLGKRCLAVLQKHYPAYAAGWDVSINSGGVLYIRNTLLAGRMGCAIHTAKLSNDPQLKKVMRYGGELLERYSLARSRSVSEEYVLDRLEDATRAHTGEMIAET